MPLLLTKNTLKLSVKHLKIVFLLLGLTFVMANKNGLNQEKPISWAQTTLDSMSLKEKIGQLFMVAAYSNRDLNHKNEIMDLIKNHHIGGLIFFQGGPNRQANLTNEYQKNAKIPLFMAMDAEWGLAMRIDSSVKYPRQMTLGAIRNQNLIYEMGKQIALQSRRIGMQINFAPVVDVNVNPLNPVIGTRSFGENKEEVSSRAIQYMNGMQNQYVLANAKHFPGHGDTDTDSHLDLPIIKHDLSRLKDIELYPFKRVFDAGIKSVMVAHIHIPSIDNTTNKPTTLSYNAVTTILKKEMGFQGLSFTDALNMKGVANYDAPGQTDLMALKAGNDVLLYPMDVPKAILAIEKAVTKGEVTIEDLNNHVLKILQAKEWSKIKECQFVSLNNLYQDLNKPEYEALNYHLRASALTLVKTSTNFPILPKFNKKILHLVIGTDMPNFTNIAEKYTLIDQKVIPKSSINTAIINQILAEYKKYDEVIFSVNELSNDTKSNFGVTPQLLQLIQQIGSKEHTVTCHFGNAYSLKNFESCSQLITAYENHPYAHKAMAQAVFGAKDIDGILPISTGAFAQGHGIISLARKGVLGFETPENLGMDSKTLVKIDSIVKAAIDSRATPGCQVLIAKKGKIVYEKNYGFTTYEKTSAVTSSTLYDLASVTKVLASGMALMRLDAEGKFDINKKLKDYLPELDSTNKGELVIKEILAHQSGLQAFIPYWSKTVQKGVPMPYYYSKTKSEEYPLQVANELYAKVYLRDSIYKWSNESPLSPKNKQGKYPYKYSDVGYYYMLKIIEKLTGQTIDQYLYSNVYQKLNLQSLGYLPLNKFSKTTIAPTEKDTYFRNQLVQGYVHDQGAAMMGGIAGHAGLFSNAYDVAQILQLTLNDGNHYDQTILNNKIIRDYTSKQLEGENRKGATWDRMRPEGQGPTSDYASDLSYGHTGFTGTMVWVDPAYDLTFVFLSNRVYPDAGNNDLLKYDVRSKIQDVIYESILNFNTTNTLNKLLQQK